MRSDPLVRPAFLLELCLTVVFALLAVVLVVQRPNLADNNPSTDGLTVTCDVVADSTPATVNQSGVPGAVPGEWVTFTHTTQFDAGTVFQEIIERPDGSTYWASRLELGVLDGGLVFDPDSVELRIAPATSTDPLADGVIEPLTVGTQPAPSGFVLASTVSGGDIAYEVLFPGDVAAQLAGQSGEGVASRTIGVDGEIFVVSFRAQVPTAASAGTVYDGAECFASVSTGPSNRDSSRLRAAVASVVPEIAIEKSTAAANAYQAGATVEYTLTANVPTFDRATGLIAVAPARDVEIVDTLPATLEPLDDAGAVVADGGTTAGGGIWDEATRTITYAVGDVMPGATWTITVPMRIRPGTPAAVDVRNDLHAAISYLPGDGVADDTVIDPAATDDALVTVASPAPSIDKVSDVENYGTDLPITYTVTVDVPAGTSYENFTISDTLPDGMTFLSYGTATCTPVGPECPDPIDPLIETVVAGGGTVIGWYPDTMPVSAAARQIVLTYTAEIDPEYADGDPVEFFDEFANNATVHWNTVDRLGDVPPSTAGLPQFDGEVSTTDPVIYDRPILQLDKTALTSDGVAADARPEDWDYQPGETVTYTTTVTNVGSRDATNLAVADSNTSIEIDVDSVLIDGNPCGDCAVDPSSGELTFTVAGPLAPGATATITYDAVPTDTGDLSNLISIPTYEDDLGTEYAEVPTDAVTLIVPDPVLTIDKFTPVGAATGYGNTVGTEVEFGFTVTNTSSATAYNVTITDTPPPGTCNVAGGLVPQAGITEAAEGIWTLDDPLDGGASVTFEAIIEICDTIALGAHVNDVEVVWEDTADGLDSDGNPYMAVSDEPFLLDGPQFEVAKGPEVDAGASINFTTDTASPNSGAWSISITNTSSVPTGGLVIDDPMPETFEYLPGTATVVWLGQSPATLTDNSAASGTAVLAGHTEQVLLELGQLAPGATARVTIPFSHNGEAPADGQLSKINTVQVRNANVEFDPEVHEAQGEYSIIPIERGPSIEKTVSTTSTYTGDETEPAAPGATRWFHLDVTLPGDPTNPIDPLTAHDLLIQDTLPDGLTLPAITPAYGDEGGSQPAGWDVVCLSGPCSAEFDGAWLGSSPTGDATTLLWWFGDYTESTDSVYRITFPVVVEREFATGDEVIDGVNDPLVNSARPLFNRDTDLGTGASGDRFVGLPATAPDPATEFDRAYLKDRAEIDIVTPRLDIDKQGYRADGEPVREINAGEVITYEIVITNSGSGPAYDVVVEDNLGRSLGVNRMNIDVSSLSATPAGVVCSVSGSPQQLDCDYAGPLAGDPDGTGPLSGDQIVITYEATALPSADLVSPTSTQNHDPDIIRNEVNTPSYFEVPAAGRPVDANEYSTGQAVVRTFVYTPAPEIEVGCYGDTHLTSLGGTAQWLAVIGNGDIYGSSDWGGDYLIVPAPTLDADGDGRIESAIGFEPELRLTIPSNYTYESTEATGPGPLGGPDDTYTAFVPFPDPDRIVDNGNGTQTLIWDRGTIDDIPPSPNHTHASNFQPEYRLIISATKIAGGSSTIEGSLSFLDGAGNPSRGTNSGEPFTYFEEDANGCPGGSPNHIVEKFPDADDNVEVEPGGIVEFTISLQQDRSETTGNQLVDVLPHGLDYIGDPAAGDPDYAPTTISPLPDGWTSLEDYLTSVTVDPISDETTIVWDVPSIPKGDYTITMPVRGDDPPPFPNELLVNTFTWYSDQGTRADTGAVLATSGADPRIDKRIDETVKRFGEQFTYTIDVTIPAGFAANDVTIRDYINWRDSRSQTGLVYGDSQGWPNRSGTSLNRAWDAPPAEFVSYDTAACISGCTGIDPISGLDDRIDAIGLAPLPLQPYNPLDINETTTDPRGANYRYLDQQNNAIGWYLGDIVADPQGQDRIVRITYTVEYPTIEEFRDVVATRSNGGRATQFPGGATDPAFNDVSNAYFEGMSEYYRPNLVILDHHGGSQDAWFDSADLANDTGWWREMNTNAVAEDHAVAGLAYPVVVPTKDCRGTNGTQKPDPTPLGTPNVECTVTLTNTTGVTAYDVSVTDTPEEQCYLRGRHIDGYTGANGSWETAPYDCDISGENVNHPNLTSPPNTFPATWSGIELDPYDSVSFSYSLRVDGFTNSTWHDWRYDRETGGSWRNAATVSPWRDDPAGTLIGSPWTYSETVDFPNPRLNIFKFPYVNPLTDSRPFASEYYARNGEGEAANADLHHPWDHCYLYGRCNSDDPYDEIYTEYVPSTDRLEPVKAFYDEWFDRPFYQRTLYRFAFPSWGTSSWLQHNVNNWFHFDQTDPDNWSDEYLVTPGETYSWIIDVFSESPGRFEQITLTDTLPYGWTYVPGSARMVDGTWLLSRNDGPQTASDSPVETGYEEIPLRDPIVSAGTRTACSAAAYQDGGPELTWQFERDTPGLDEFWNIRYVDGRDWERKDAQDPTGDRYYEAGTFDKINDHVIIFDTMPDPSIVGCDPDHTDTTPFFFENNVRIDGLRDFDSGVTTETYAQAVPLPVPVALEKTPDNEYIRDDSSSAFTVTFTNDLAVPVTDITLTDTLSIISGIPPQSGSGYTCGTATAVGGTGFDEVRCDESGSPTTGWDIEWFFSSIAPGETVTITMPIVAPPDEANGLVYDNTVTTTVKEWYDHVLTDEGRITVVNPSPPSVPTKSSSPNPATVNDIVEYSISWVAGPTQIFADLAYIDTVPDGLTLIEYGDVTCSGDCPGTYSGADVVELTPVPNPDGTTSLMWWFGNVPGSAGGATWTMTYSVRVDGAFDSGTEIADGDQLVNTVIGYSNEESLLAEPATIPDPSTWTTYAPSAPATETLDVREPELAIAKAATPSAVPTDSSSTIEFTVTVTNTGVMNAYGVVVTDTPNGALENAVLDVPTFPGAVATRGWTAIDPTVGWFIPVLAPGETAEFTYTAEVTDDFITDGFPAAENIAEIDEMRARPGLEPEPGDRIYDPDVSAETSTPLVGPGVEIDKYIGADCTDEFAFVDVDDAVTWCLEVRNTGDTIAYHTTVRDTLPYRWTYDGPTTGTGWSVAEPTQGTLATDVVTLEWDLGDLPVGETAQIVFVTTPEVGSPSNVTNWATVETLQSDETPYPITVTAATDDDPAAASIDQFAIEISKTPDRQEFGYIDAGGEVVWDLTITNPSADTDNTNLVVTDFLPSPLTYDSWASTDGRVSFVSAGPGPGGTTAIVWNISDLEAGESVTIELTADAPGTVVEGTWYVNDVQVVSDEVTDLVVNQAKVRFYEPASLGDYTWIDANADGLQDAGDTPLDGVTINLLDGNGNQLYRDPDSGVITTDPTAGFPPMTTVSGDDPDTPGTEVGWYEFDDLPAGNYQVEFVPPTGYTLTWNDIGGDDAADADADPNTGVSPVVSLDPGEHDPTIDAGFIDDPGLNSLGDFVWLDVDQDGVQDGAGEPGIEGVTVDLYTAGPDGVFGTPDDLLVASTVTDVDGGYGFENLPDGEYRVVFSLDPANPDHDDLVPTWEDQGSGVGSDDAVDSDANRESGASHVVDLDSAGVDADPVVDPTVDAGFFEDADAVNEIGDFVWLDLDADGVQDAGEPGVAGVVVELLDPVTGVVLATTMTDGDGFYEFTNLPDGNYQVRFSLDPANPAHDDLAPTAENNGDDATDSDANISTGLTHVIALDPDGIDPDPVVDPTIDAGFIDDPSAVNSLGDFVWLDVDQDGVQDGGEAPIEGVVVDLYAAGPDGIIGTADDIVWASTVTDVDGGYGFENLPDGEYRVVFSLDPANPDHDDLVPTWEDQGSGVGSDDAVDSDANRESGASHVVDLDSAGVDADPVVDPTVDAGFFEDADAVNEIGDFVWLDLDADGVQDAGEPGVAGVVVELLDPVTGVVLATTMTDGDGFYEFTNLPDGNYQVRFSLDPANPAHDDLAPTAENNGDDATDSDANISTGLTHVIALDPDGIDPDPVVDPTIDAGFIDDPSAVNSLGDFVWLDVDQDGVQDGGEAPIEGVVVDLYAAGPDGIIGTADDIVWASTVTDVDGGYGFENLPDGEYRVVFSLDPANPDHDDLVPTWEDQGSGVGSDDAVDSDANRESGASHVVDLDSAGVDADPVVDPTVDAGFFEDADAVNEIGDFVWLDLDADGVQDAGEPGVAGVVVELLDPVTGVVLATTMTDGDGFYEFTNLPDGNYQVRFSLDPANPAHDDLAPTAENNGDDATDSDADRNTGLTAIIALDPDGTDPDPVVDPTIDAGYVSDGSAVNALGDHVWLDADLDGIQDAGEDPLPGVTVELFTPGPDGVFGTPDDLLLATEVTDADGAYLFENLPDGDYQVAFTLDPANPDHEGLAPTWPNQGTDDAADSNASRTTGRTDTIELDPTGSDPNPIVDPTIDAGFFEGNNAIGDFVWHDIDGDGIQDADEAGIPGAVVNLIDPVTGAILDSTMTDADGSYEFTNLPDGTYQVGFELPAGYEFTTPDVDTDDGADSDADPTTGLSAIIELDPDGADDDPIIDPTIDAGVYLPVSIGDYVWLDEDRDGIQDPDEDGIGDVTVNLRGPGPDGVFGTADDEILATTTTAADGSYLFDGLPPGEYQVEFVLTSVPDGVIPTFTGTGTDDTDDSDIDRATGLAPVVVLDSGEHDPTIDAGVFDEDVDLVITKDTPGSVQSGAPIEWTITVRNDGLDPYDDVITTVDDLPEGLQYVSHVANGWNCTITGQRVECDWVTGLLPGATTLPIVITTILTDGEFDNVSNTAIVHSVQAESRVVNNTAEGVTRVERPEGRLPFTGGGLTQTLPIAAMLLIAGAMLVVAGKLRRPALVKD